MLGTGNTGGIFLAIAHLAPRKFKWYAWEMDDFLSGFNHRARQYGWNGSDLLVAIKMAQPRRPAAMVANLILQKVKENRAAKEEAARGEEKAKLIPPQPPSRTEPDVPVPSLYPAGLPPNL